MRPNLSSGIGNNLTPGPERSKHSDHDLLLDGARSCSQNARARLACLMVVAAGRDPGNLEQMTCLRC